MTVQEYMTRSDGYDRITKTLTKYEFRRLIEQMGITLSDFEIKTINRMLDPDDSGQYSMVKFFNESMSQSTSYLN